MNIDNFKKMVDTYGVSLERWPNRVSHESLELLEKEPLAKQYLLQEAQWDEWLANYQIPEVPLSLQNSIFQSLPQYPQQSFKVTAEDTIHSKFALLVLCALMGFLFAKAPFLFHLLQYENALLFIQFEQMAFLQNEELFHE